MGCPDVQDPAKTHRRGPRRLCGPSQDRREGTLVFLFIPRFLTSFHHRLGIAEPQQSLHLPDLSHIVDAIPVTLSRHAPADPRLRKTRTTSPTSSRTNRVQSPTRTRRCPTATPSCRNPFLPPGPTTSFTTSSARPTRRSRRLRARCARAYRPSCTKARWALRAWRSCETGPRKRFRGRKSIQTVSAGFLRDQQQALGNDGC